MTWFTIILFYSAYFYKEKKIIYINGGIEPILFYAHSNNYIRKIRLFNVNVTGIIQSMNESCRKLVFQQVSLIFFLKLFLNVPILIYLCKAMQLICLEEAGCQKRLIWYRAKCKTFSFREIWNKTYLFFYFHV